MRGLFLRDLEAEEAIELVEAAETVRGRFGRTPGPRVAGVGVGGASLDSIEDVEVKDIGDIFLATLALFAQIVGCGQFEMRNLTNSREILNSSGRYQLSLRSCEVLGNALVKVDLVDAWLCQIKITSSNRVARIFARQSFSSFDQN